MAVKLITAYTGTRHILASNAANVGKAAYSVKELASGEAAYTGESVILSDGGSLAETTNVGSKKMTISAGVLLFSGRFVEITSTDTDTLVFPSSDSIYRKIVTGIEYSKNTDSTSSDYLTETCVYKAYVSADCTSSTQAAGVSNDSIITPSARTIGASTTSAFLPLYETIVNKTSQISKKCLLGTMPSVRNIQKTLAETISRVEQVEEDVDPTEEDGKAYATKKLLLEKIAQSRVQKLTPHTVYYTERRKYLLGDDYSSIKRSDIILIFVKGGQQFFFADLQNCAAASGAYIYSVGTTELHCGEYTLNVYLNDDGHSDHSISLYISLQMGLPKTFSTQTYHITERTGYGETDVVTTVVNDGGYQTLDESDLTVYRIIPE